MSSPDHPPFAIETDRITKVYGSGNTEVVAMQDSTMLDSVLSVNFVSRVLIGG